TVLVSLAFALAAIIPSMMPTLRHNGVAAAIFAGVAFGLAGLYSKPMADSFLSGSAIEIAARAAINPFVYGVILGNIAGLIALQNSFHDARGIIAMPLSSGISTIVPIIGGMAAFGENLPADTASAALRIGAFVLTIVGAALLAHVHEDEAAEILAGEQSRSA
ncbi:MAG: hypothetical protein ACREP6_12830, partial [Candidatus Binataceae bacterium]